MRRIPPRHFLSYFRGKYRRPIRKVLYFALHDGPSKTLRKYRSKMTEKTLEAHQAILLARVAMGEGTLIGFTRDLGGPATFCPQLLFTCSEPLNLEHIMVPNEALTMLESFLPVPSYAAPPRLPELRESANPAFRRSTIAVDIGQEGAG